MRIMGIDPGLRRTGWGVIEWHNSQLRYCAHGLVTSNQNDAFEARLLSLAEGLEAALDSWQPQLAAVETVYINANPQSALKLGMARAACLLAPARRGIAVAHLSPADVKKSIVGSGRADKEQVGHMVRLLLSRAEISGHDALDALAVAIAQAHYRETAAKLGQVA